MRRALGSLAKTLGLGAVFLVAVVAGAVAHLDAPAVRRAVIGRVNAVLATAVAGRIVIDRVGSAGAGGVSDVDAHVLDPDGVTVLAVSGLSARMATAALVESLAGGRDVVVDIDGLAIRRAAVNLDGDDRGLRLARAFGARQPATPTPTTATPGPSVWLSVPHARIAQTVVHGRPAGAPPIDGEIGDADVSVSFTPEGLALALHHAHVLARDMPPAATTEGTIEATLSIPSVPGSGPRVRAAWKGRAGEVPVEARARFADGAVDGVVDVPSTAPAQLRSLWPACPFGEAAAAHAELHGQLPALAVIASASVGRGAIAVSGPVIVGEETFASLHLVATAVDAHAIAGAAPSSDVGLTAQASIVRGRDGALGGLVVLDLLGGTLGGSRLPGVGVVAHASADPGSPPRAEASVTVRLPGAPVQATLQVIPRGSSFQVAFDASATAPRVDLVRGVGPAVGGSVRADAKGSLDLASGRLDAAAAATLSSMHAGAASLAGATLAVRATGPVSAPAIDLDLVGRDLAAEPLHFDTFHARMHGPPTHAPVHVSLHGHGADFVARADLDVQGGVTLRELSVAMDRGGESLRASASVVRIASGQATVDGFDLEGLGTPLHATIRAAPGTLEIHAKSRGLDLARLGRITGLPSVGGRLRLDVDAELHRTAAEGHVTVDLEQGSFAGWKQASAHLEASLEGRKAVGSIKAALADVGTIDVSSATVELGGGSVLAGSSWRGAWGGADVAAHVDLTKLAAQLPQGMLPAAGAVEVKGRIARDSASDATPDVDLSAATRGLLLTGSAAPWTMAGIAATLHVTVDGKTGHTALGGKLADAGGALLSLDAASDSVPYARLFSAAPITLSDLTSMPFQATVTVPSRGVATLPAALGTRGVQGDLEARVDWRGPIVKPSVDLRATLSGGKPDVAVLSMLVDVAVTGHYDGAHASVAASATERGRTVLDATAVLDAVATELLGAGPAPWTASARAKLSDFPLQSIAALDNRQVRGRANGTIQIDGLHRDARGSVSLELDRLQVGDVPCKPATISLTADGRALDFSARVTEEDGYAEARAHAGASWGAEMVPSADRNQPAQLFFAAKHFRSAVLLPFVAGTLTELDGRVDANASVVIDPAARTMKPQGTIALSDGVLEVSALGNELHDVKATITMTPDGVIRMDRASARGLTGLLEVAASARFQGFDLTGVRALVQVPKKEPIPLVVDGVQAGLFDGKVDVTVAREKTALAVNLEIPSMRLQLPLSASHDVQTLGAMPGVEVGIAQGSAGFVPETLDGGDHETAVAPGTSVPVHVAVHLGKDVEIRRGGDLDVHLEGGPTVEVGRTVTAKGQIRLARGSLNVQGKTFSIDKGTVTFVDDPTNPQVVLTASWAAPDGTTIFADFVGPLKTGKVSLRSEPVLKQDEILALLLYGTIDQTGASGTGAPQLGVASGAAGNAASEKLNQALGGVNQALDNLGLNAGISTKLDTSEVTPRPEVEVQIARDISLQVAWVLGVPPPGSNPDQHLFTLNWRFLRQWSVQTTVGDAGTSILDLVWQHRY